MTSRFRLAWIVGAFALVGCDDAQYAGPILYRDSERMANDLGDKPKLQAVVRKSLADLYGDDLRHIKVPENSGLRGGGIYLADRVWVGDSVEPVTDKDPATGRTGPIDGGYALYRKHCLHCHGVFGAGDGPTASFLYPRPRDYRLGIFKFTSTTSVNAKPTRADLRKTILYGLHGTSMPGFEATMNPTQIEQVIDYMTFLSIRGETEKSLIDEAMNSEDVDAASALDENVIKTIVQTVAGSWKEAETNVFRQPARRVGPSKESILRGRDFFLGTNQSGNKLECAKCHGASGKGNGEAFSDPEIFRDVVFRQWRLDQVAVRLYRRDRDREARQPGSGIKLNHQALQTFLTEKKERLTQYVQEEKVFKEKGDLPPRDLKANPKSLEAYLAGKKDLLDAFVDGKNKETSENLSEIDEKVIDLYAKEVFGLGREEALIRLDVARYLEETPAAWASLRMHESFLPSVPDRVLVKRIHDDPIAMGLEALKLQPALDDPDFRTFLAPVLDLWSKSLDVWQNPLRPANLVEGIYKGGRRPIDLFWRLAKGINGAKMPEHAGLLTDDQIWDVVNFVLALPEDPDLLPDPPAALTRPAKVAD